MNRNNDEEIRKVGIKWSNNFKANKIGSNATNKENIREKYIQSDDFIDLFIDFIK